MSWYSVPVVFSVEAPTEEAAALLAEDQHAVELTCMLECCDFSVTALGEDCDEDASEDGGSLFERYLVVVTCVIEAGEETGARKFVEAGVAELNKCGHDFREIRQPEATDNPAKLTETTKLAISAGKSMLVDGLRRDILSLKRGSSFSETAVLYEVLPACFAQHYTSEFIEHIIDAIETTEQKLLAYPEGGLLSCTAEELAAHALIYYARNAFDMHPALEGADEGHVTEQLDDMDAGAFEDHDVLMLFDSRNDGIESSDLADEFGFANLHVTDWFRRFRS